MWCYTRWPGWSREPSSFTWKNRLSDQNIWPWYSLGRVWNSEWHCGMFYSKLGFKSWIDVLDSFEPALHSWLSLGRYPRTPFSWPITPTDQRCFQRSFGYMGLQLFIQNPRWSRSPEDHWRHWPPVCIQIVFCSSFQNLIFVYSISAVPPYPGLRRFPDGRDYNQWTGDDSKALMKVRQPWFRTVELKFLYKVIGLSCRYRRVPSIVHGSVYCNLYGCMLHCSSQCHHRSGSPAFQIMCWEISPSPSSLYRCWSSSINISPASTHSLPLLLFNSSVWLP